RRQPNLRIQQGIVLWGPQEIKSIPSIGVWKKFGRPTCPKGITPYGQEYPKNNQQGHAYFCHLFHPTESFGENITVKGQTNYKKDDGLIEYPGSTMGNIDIGIKKTGCLAL